MSFFVLAAERHARSTKSHGGAGGCASRPRRALALGGDALLLRQHRRVLRTQEPVQLGLLHFQLTRDPSSSVLDRARRIVSKIKGCTRRADVAGVRFRPRRTRAPRQSRAASCSAAPPATSPMLIAPTLCLSSMTKRYRDLSTCTARSFSKSSRSHRGVLSPCSISATHWCASSAFPPTRSPSRRPPGDGPARGPDFRASSEDAFFGAVALRNRRLCELRRTRARPLDLRAPPRGRSGRHVCAAGSRTRGSRRRAPSGTASRSRSGSGSRRGSRYTASAPGAP